MQWPDELYAADVTRDPPDRSFKCFQPVELDPHALGDARPLDELDLAPDGGCIEHPDPERLHARAPDAHFGIDSNANCASDLRRT